MIIIHKYIHVDQYYVTISPLELTWSDAIIARFYQQFNIIAELPQPTILRDALLIERGNLISLVSRILKSDVSLFKKEFKMWDRQSFIEDTAPVAVGVNGTACVGKTTILNMALEKIQKYLDPQAQILKAGKFGGFKGKDREQTAAMQYQAITFAVMGDQYTSIADRDMFNNFIWRIIMAHQCTRTCTAEKIVDNVLNKVSSNMIEVMSKQPIMIILDFNIVQNRMRMYKRANGGDRTRCFIQYYTPAQNAVYGLFAYLCKWPTFHRCFSENVTDKEAGLVMQKEMVNLIYEKLQTNVRRYNDVLPFSDTLKLGKFVYTLPKDEFAEYNIAEALGIFK